MKLKQIIEDLDKSKFVTPNFQDLYEYFNLDYSYEDFVEKSEDLKGYHIEVWLCTDTWVGTIAWFLKDELVYITHQPARKSDIAYAFINKESADNVKDYLILLLKESQNSLKHDYINLNEEWPDVFKIQYNSQILHKFAWYNDEKVEIIKSNFAYDFNNKNNDDYFHRVDVKYMGPSKVFSVLVSELRFDYGYPT